MQWEKNQWGLLSVSLVPGSSRDSVLKRIVIEQNIPNVPLSLLCLDTHMCVCTTHTHIHKQTPQIKSPYS